jgi:hypothetical protein
LRKSITSEIWSSSYWDHSDSISFVEGRIEVGDLLSGLGLQAQQHLPAIRRMGLAAHVARLLETVDHAGDSAGGKAGGCGEITGAGCPFGVDDIEALQIGAVDTGNGRDTLAEQDALTGHHPHRPIQFREKRIALLTTG